MANWFKKVLKDALKLFKSTTYLTFEVTQEKVRNTIEPGIEMQGMQFWALTASCLIAAIGLNLSSSVILIGAMLISPLMWPILGIGLGLAIRNRRLLRKSSIHFLFSMSWCLFVSSMFFLVSPIREVTPEILSRISPTLLDLIVAIAAAFAGAIFMVSPGFLSILPGVAIAVAILPPICATGYGLAHFDWGIITGSFYLFLINALSIALVGYLTFKRMRLTRKEDEEQTISRIIVGVVLVFLVVPPSVTLFRLWQKRNINQQITAVVRSYEDKLGISSWKLDLDGERNLKIFSFEGIGESEKEAIVQKFKEIDPMLDVTISTPTTSESTKEMLSQLKSSGIFSLLTNPQSFEWLIGSVVEKYLAKQPKIDVSKLEDELGLFLGEKLAVHLSFATPKQKQKVIVNLEELVDENQVKKERVENQIKAWAKLNLKEDQELVIFWHSKE